MRLSVTALKFRNSSRDCIHCNTAALPLPIYERYWGVPIGRSNSVCFSIHGSPAVRVRSRARLRLQILVSSGVSPEKALPSKRRLHRVVRPQLTWVRRHAYKRVKQRERAKAGSVGARPYREYGGCASRCGANRR